MIVVALTTDEIEQRFGPFTAITMAEDLVIRLAATGAYLLVQILHTDDMRDFDPSSRGLIRHE